MSDSVGGVAEQEPDPRVEAAAKALYEHYRITQDFADAPVWDDATEEHRANGRADIAVALAAADAVDPQVAQLAAIRAELAQVEKASEYEPKTAYWEGITDAWKRVAALVGSEQQ